MTEEFLKWFFDQKPFRPCRLVLINGDECAIARPEHIGFNFNDTIRICHDHGMGMQTIDIKDIIEIRQSIMRSDVIC